MMPISYPYELDSKGRTMCSTGNEYIKEMIEQVLLTSPGGERVNRPQFGCGLREKTFDSINGEVLRKSDAMIRARLQRYLGDLINVKEVDVEGRESTLFITIKYFVLQSERTETHELSVEVQHEAPA